MLQIDIHKYTYTLIFKTILSENKFHTLKKMNDNDIMPIKTFVIHNF